MCRAGKLVELNKKSNSCSSAFLGYIMIEHKKIVTEIKTRFRDIDSMGHVNNAVYLTYFEEGRKEFIYSLFGIINPEDYNFILAHIACDFLKPISIVRIGTCSKSGENYFSKCVVLCLTNQ